MVTAYSERQEDYTFEQAADLSAAQYLAVKIVGDNQVNLAGAGEDAIGILQVVPAADHSEVGRAVSVACGGICRAIFGGTVAAGDKVTPDAAGKLVVATSTAKVIGTAIIGGGADDIGSVMIQQSGQFASA